MAHPIITVDGFECLLVLSPINWRRRPRITLQLAADEVEGITGIEGRASVHFVPMVSLEYLYTMNRTAAEELRSAMLGLDTEARIAVPLWVDCLPSADYQASRIFASQHWVNFDAVTGDYVVDAAGEDLVYAETVGLAICALQERPKITPKTDLDADILLKVEEDSPLESRVEVHQLAQASWDFHPNWRAAPEDNSRWRLSRRRLGQGRLSSRTGQEAPAKQTQSGLYTFKGRDVLRRALTFWTTKRGPHQAFSVPLMFRPGWDGIPGNEPTMQAHFSDDNLTLEFSMPDVASSRIGFSQDLLLVDQPDQARPSRAFLFKLWWEGSATTMTWTDWEGQLVHGALAYLPKTIELKSSVETTRPGQTEWEFLVYDFDGNPLRAFGRLARERRLMLEIREADPSAPAQASLVFVGEVRSALNKGRLFTVTASLFGGALKALVPQVYTQQGCNAVCGDTICGVDLEAIKTAGMIASVDGTTIDVSCSGAAGEDVFAFGFAQFGVGDAIELRYIMKSVPIAGGQRITIHRALWTSVVGTDAVLYPGCDQQYSGGCARLGNQARFFGAPYKTDYLETVDSGYRTKTGK